MKARVLPHIVSLVILTALSSSAAWRGEVESSNGPSGRAAAYDAACLALAGDIGKRLADESRTFPLFRENEHAFDARVGKRIARMWIQMCPGPVRPKYDVRGDAYACTVTFEGDFPTLASVHSNLLTDAVLTDRRIHPLILLELAGDEEERQRVITAFADRLSSPVLSDYFLDDKITAYSPSAAYELARHPEILDELPPTELLHQLQALPGHVRVMKKLCALAEQEGRGRAARWLGTRAPASNAKEPKIVQTNWLHVAQKARQAHDFVTPALTWLYAKRQICRYGSIRPPQDEYFEKARTLADAGLHREAYEQYLRSADRTLSYDACLGAAEAAAHVGALAAEADFFLLQAAAIDPKRVPERLAKRERERARMEGDSDD